MVISQEIRDAVAAAMGYEIGDRQIADAVDYADDSETADLRLRLAAAQERLDDAGGRGVWLAEHVDALRIAIAARNEMPKPS